MVDKLEFSLLVSEFDQIRGPVPVISYPEIKVKLARQIAHKTIDFLFDEESLSSSSLAFLPFSSGKKKVIAIIYAWKDESLRGSTGTGTLSLVFREADDFMYHRHIKELEPIFQDASNQFIQLKLNHAEEDQELIKLKEIYTLFEQKLGTFTKRKDTPKVNYRSMNMIIQKILESIIKAERNKANPREGIIKSHLIDYCSLKSTTADKYFTKLETAGYIEAYNEPWGQRTRIVYKTTEKGRERYQWFIQINMELEAFS